MIPFSITKYQLEYANRLSKNKALRNILLLSFAVRLELLLQKNLQQVGQRFKLSISNFITNIYYLWYSVKLILYNFFLATAFFNQIKQVPWVSCKKQ